MALTLQIVTASAASSLLLSQAERTCIIHSIHSRYQPLAVGSCLPYNLGETFNPNTQSQIQPVPCKKVT